MPLFTPPNVNGVDGYLGVPPALDGSVHLTGVNNDAK